MPLLVGLIVVIAAELVVLVEVARAIGVLAAVLLLILVSASGPWLVRRAGLGVWRRTRDRVRAGQPPGAEALDGATLLLGGVLVCVPGFITDVIGLALLLAPVRALARRLVLRHFTRRVGGLGGRPGWRGRGSRGEVITTDAHPADPGPPLEPPR